MQHLQSLGWQLETAVNIVAVVRPGPMDATCRVGERLFCVEWETGNVSSSHRALNKMAPGLMFGQVVGGVLIIPTAAMARYLTDRVGKFQEIAPYFPLWRFLARAVKEGILIVISIEHDYLDAGVPLIWKGTDGRALR